MFVLMKDNVIKTRPLWAEISDLEVKLLKVLIICSEITATEISFRLGISKASLFNKLKGKTRLKQIELEKLLSILQIEKDKLKQLSGSEVLNYI